MDNLKKLQDEAVALANRIDAVRAIESTDADKIAERDLELETLNADAAKLSKKIDFEKSVAEASKNLRSVVDRCTPAPEVRAACGGVCKNNDFRSAVLQGSTPVVAL